MATVPRNFRLLEELEKAEKGKLSNGISYGLASQYDIELKLWRCMVLLNDGDLISVLVYTSHDYPKDAPKVHLETKMKLRSDKSKTAHITVNFKTGAVDVAKYWNSLKDSDKNINRLLSQIKSSFNGNAKVVAGSYGAPAWWTPLKDIAT